MMKVLRNARRNTILFAAVFVTAGPAHAATLMDAGWAGDLCKAWNANATLTTELGGDAWAKNNAGRGFKVIHLYREKCGPGSAVELVITDKDGKAVCTHGGAITEAVLNKEVDYLMHATDEDWACMGEGKFGCGAMGAMMSGKLQFSGPKAEAMKVMGPFESFLQLTGTVPGSTDACP
jgi:putative sterol carrier protein